MHIVDVEFFNTDPVGYWIKKPLYSVYQAALLMTGIDPTRFKSFQEFMERGWREFPENQMRRASFHKELILDGLFLGSLTAHKILVEYGDSNFNFRKEFINQIEIDIYEREDISLENTSFIREVFLLWLKKQNITTVKQELKELKQANANTLLSIEKPQFLYPDAPLLKQVSYVQHTFWSEYKEGDKPVLQKVIVDDLRKQGISEIKAKAIDVVAAPVLRHDKTKKEK